MQNHFVNAPTVGSHDQSTATDELQARISQLEQRLAVAEGQRATPEAKRSGKIRWKKVRKFFNTFVRPILDFIPKIINAVCRYKEVARA